MSDEAKPPRRQNDSPDFDPRGSRYWHGMPAPEEFANPNEVKVGWGDKSMSLRGPMVIMAVLLITLGALIFYLHGIQLQGQDVLAKRIEMQTCLLSLTPEERVALRGALSNVRKIETAEYYIRAWCPWIGR